MRSKTLSARNLSSKKRESQTWDSKAETHLPFLTFHTFMRHHRNLNSLDSVPTTPPGLEDPRSGLPKPLRPLEAWEAGKLDDPLVKDEDREDVGNLARGLGGGLEQRVVVDSEVTGERKEQARREKGRY